MARRRPGLPQQAPPRTPGRVLVPLLAVLLFMLAACYRFNTLGGALGGFDNDHFVPFTYAKQVEAGERPLRDFAGVGLQGVWPSLTFELSAWAQRLLGDNLRSEALLSVFGLSAAAALTFAAAAYVSPVPVAAGAAVLSVLLEPKLYSYPKLLVLAGALFLCGRYAVAPRRGPVVGLAVLTAIAFLFRHDLAVYVGAGAVVVLGGAAGSVKRAAGHLLAYGAVTALCLAPSIVFVQRHGGLQTYVEDSIFAVRQESRRTTRIDRGIVLVDDAGRPVPPLGFLGEQQNATWWLYQANSWLPVLMLLGVVALPGGPQGRRAVLAACAVMTLVVAPSFLRGNTGARFGDMAPLTAVLMAGGAAMAFGAARSLAPAGVAAAVLTVAVLAATTQSVWTVGNVRSELDASGLSDSASKVGRQTARLWGELGALPAGYWTGEAPTATLRAVQYLHACTRPADRVIVLSYQPELLPLADRRFGGGGMGMVPGLLILPKHQQAMVERWKREAVPLVLVESGPEDATEIPIILEYLRSRYAEAGLLEVDRGKLTVWADQSRLTGDGRFDATGLPCFR